MICVKLLFSVVVRIQSVDGEGACKNNHNVIQEDNDCC